MIWKHARDYENLYEVSSTGLIRTIPREIIRSNGRKYTVKRRVLKPAKDGCGYLRVGLSKNGKLFTEKVHRLVAKTFLVADYSLEVNHKNGIKTENNIENLEFVTRSQNQLHAFKTGLQTGKKGELNSSAKIDDIKALTIKTLICSGWKLIDISRELAVSIHIVKDISRGKTWSHIGI